MLDSLINMYLMQLLFNYLKTLINVVPYPLDPENPEMSLFFDQIKL